MVCWSLADVIDLEVLQERLGAWRQAWQEGVGEKVEEIQDAGEKERRRAGLKWMLEVVRGEEGASVGALVVSRVRAVEWILLLVMVMVGAGLVSGLITDYSYSEWVLRDAGQGELKSEAARGFNIWVLLAVTLGVPSLVLLVSVLLFVFCRRGGRPPIGLQAWLGRWACRWGGESAGRWWQLVSDRFGGLGQKMWSWRLSRVLQAGGVGFNLGLLIGLFACLWFTHVGFYWETSLPQFGQQSLSRVSEVLAWPVGGSGVDERAVGMANVQHQPEVGDWAAADSGSIPLRMQINLAWGAFFFSVIAFWGLMPRVLLWLMCWKMESKVLAAMDFQESAQRQLWREVNRVDRGEVVSTPADGVVLMDIGGIDLSTEKMRPYCLQVLRVNPEARYVLGSLNAEQEREAMETAKQAAMGVVFLVEGWNLSPKQMGVYHRRVRQAIGESHMIRYLVLGNDEEMAHWESLVDSLQDAECEVYQFRGEV